MSLQEKGCRRQTTEVDTRQVHRGGERLFVDYAGQTVPVVDAASGEVRRAQVFVAVLGASNCICACATWPQTAADWVGAIIATLSFIGGVPRLLVPDPPRALIANPNACQPVNARLLENMSRSDWQRHVGTMPCVGLCPGLGRCRVEAAAPAPY